MCQDRINIRCIWHVFDAQVIYRTLKPCLVLTKNIITVEIHVLFREKYLTRNKKQYCEENLNAIASEVQKTMGHV